MTAFVSRTGLTYREWQDQRIADYLAWRRHTLRLERYEYEREFLADANGYLPGIEKIHNDVTGEWVALPEPLRVHVDDLDRVIEEFQARFLAQWEAEHA